MKWLSWVALAAALACLTPAAAFWQSRDGSYNQSVSSGGATRTLVQGNFGTAFSGTTVAATLGSSIITGHSLRISINVQPLRTVSSIAGGGNTYCSQTPAATNTTTQEQWQAIATNVTGGFTTVTATMSGTISNASILVEEWSGDTTAACASSLTGNNSTYTAGTTSTPLPSGSFSANSGDGLWTALFQANGVLATVPTGFTLAHNYIPSATGWVTAALNSQATTTTVNPTWTGGTNSFDNFVGAFAVK